MSVFTVFEGICRMPFCSEPHTTDTQAKTHKKKKGVKNAVLPILKWLPVKCGTFNEIKEFNFSTVQEKLIQFLFFLNQKKHKMLCLKYLLNKRKM